MFNYSPLSSLLSPLSLSLDWKEKDKDHQEWDEKLRQSQEQPPQEHVCIQNNQGIDTSQYHITLQHQHSYSGSEDYTANLTHMHPLLRQAAEERYNTCS